jgi:hypothetical protein
MFKSSCRSVYNISTNNQQEQVDLYFNLFLLTVTGRAYKANREIFTDLYMQYTHH